MKTNPNIVPLSGGFMVTALIGGIISALYVLPRTVQWGTAFIVFFGIMLIASLISMTYSPVEEHLKIHEKKPKN